jgi:hypothetical protein
LAKKAGLKKPSLSTKESMDRIHGQNPWTESMDRIHGRIKDESRIYFLKAKKGPKSRREAVFLARPNFMAYANFSEALNQAKGEN